MRGAAYSVWLASAVGLLGWSAVELGRAARDVRGPLATVLNSDMLHPAAVYEDQVADGYRLDTYRFPAANYAFPDTAAYFATTREERLSFLGLSGLAAMARLTPLQARQWLTEQFYLQREAVGRDASEVLDTFVYYQGISVQQWGVGAAAGLFKALVVVAFAINLFLAIIFDRYMEFSYDDTFFPHGNG